MMVNRRIFPSTILPEASPSVSRTPVPRCNTTMHLVTVQCSQKRPPQSAEPRSLDATQRRISLLYNVPRRFRQYTVTVYTRSRTLGCSLHTKLRAVSGVRGGNYGEFRLLGCDAVWLGGTYRSIIRVLLVIANVVPS
jgi:hypothetical protein